MRPDLVIARVPVIIKWVLYSLWTCITMNVEKSDFKKMDKIAI